MREGDWRHQFKIMSTDQTESSVSGRRLFSAIAGWTTTTLTSRALQLGIQVHAIHSELTEYVARDGTEARRDTMSVLLRVRSSATSSQLGKLLCLSPKVRVANRHIAIHLRIQSF